MWSIWYPEVDEAGNRIFNPPRDEQHKCGPDRQENEIALIQHMQSLYEQLAGVQFAENLFDGPVKVFRTRHDERGAVLGRDDVEVGHRLGGGFELGDNGSFRAAAFAHVAIDAALKADFVGGIDVDAEVIERVQLGIVEREDAFDEDKLTGSNRLESTRNAGVRGEVVDGALNGVASCKGADMLNDELGFERVGVVEVTFIAGVERELREVAVVEIEREECGFELAGELAGKSGFAGAGTAGDTDEGGLDK